MRARGGGCKVFFRGGRRGAGGRSKILGTLCLMRSGEKEQTVSGK